MLVTYHVHAAYSAFSELQKQVEELSRQVEAMNAHNSLGTSGSINSSGYPDIQNSKNFFLYLEPLLLHAKVDGTSYAYTATGPANTLPIRADTRDVKFGWDWGLRSGIGYHFKPYDWIVDANYTWIDTEGDTKAASNLFGSVMPLKGVVYLGNGVEWAKSRVSVDQDSIFLRIMKSYFVSSSVSLTPYGGLKNSWIDIKQWTQYFGGSSLGNNVEHIRDRSRFWGIGPSIGGTGKFCFGRGFNFFGDLGLAFQYGLFRVEYDEVQSNDHANRIKLKESRHQFIPNFEINLGLGWGTYLNHKHNYLSLGIGYQMQYWMRANQILNVLQSNAQRYFNLAEDLSYLGIQFQAQLHF